MYRVEFFEEALTVWETIDSISEIEADTELEAIEFAKDWWMDNSDDRGIAEQEINELSWRASKIRYDEDGYLESYNWVME